MTKRGAQQRVDRGDLTWGHLSHYIEQCFDVCADETSRVNRQITRRQSLDILYAGLVGREDNELVISDRHTTRRNALNTLIAVNVLRETGGDQ